MPLRTLRGRRTTSTKGASMKTFRRIVTVGMCVAPILVLVLSINAVGQGKAEKAPSAAKTSKAEPKQTNIQGTVQDISKSSSTITVRVGTASRTVVYSADT